MSRLVAFAAIQGGYNIVSKVEGKYKKALETYNADTKVGFPNTAYYLPVIYSLLGLKVETLEDIKKPLDFARKLLPPHVKGNNHLPYLGPLLDAGMAALFAFEIEEALRYLTDPDFYHPAEEVDEDAGKIWLGAADDTVMRKRGVEFVDGLGTRLCRHRRFSTGCGYRQTDRGRVPAPQPLHLLRRQSERHHGH